MNMLLNLESSVTTAHRAKLAYIYVRQSTAGQVRQHQESTSRDCLARSNREI
jgi:hypothetical protein